MNIQDTIIAQATPKGNSSVGIIRISGNKVIQIIKEIIKKPLFHNKVLLTKIYSSNKDYFDKGLVIFFQKPKSYTGENILELHTHGNQYLINKIINFIKIKFKIRNAKHGEFTLRAFLNNKIDLIQAESIKQIIECKNIKLTKILYKNCEGEFSKKIKKLVEDLKDIRQYIEIKTNFCENENIISNKEILKKINYLYIKIKNILKNILLDNKIKNKIKICITGNSNVGKSSLFNNILKTKKSIVTNKCGTTRDTIESSFKIFNKKIILYDTAGYRKTNNIIEKKGIKSTFKIIKKSDIILYVSDKKFIKNIFKEKLFNKIIKDKKKIIIIKNKIDLYNEKPSIIKYNNFYITKISTKYQFNKKLIFNLIKKKIDKEKTKKYISSYRIKKKIKKNFQIIKKIKYYININNIDLLNEEIKIIEKNFKNILGININKNILKKIFKNFCIGK